MDTLLARADRVWAGSDRRRFVRAAICANMGDSMGVWRELRAGLYEAQDEKGMTDREIMRATMPGRVFLTRLDRPEN